jgi:tetratricopeptide (TPR) repeat protein
MAELAELAKRQNRLAEAARLRDEVLRTRQRVLGPDHADTLQSLSDLAVVQYEDGRFADSEATARVVLERRTRILGPDHPKTLESMNDLGSALREQGKLDEALAVYDRLLEARRRVLGPDHPDTGVAMLVVAQVKKSQKKYDQAAPLFEGGLAILRTALGPDHTQVLWASTSYATLLAKQGKVAESRGVSHAIEEALGRAHAGESGPAIGAILYNLGWDALLTGDKPRAVALMRQALERGLERGTARSIVDEPDVAPLAGTTGFDELIAAVKARYP